MKISLKKGNIENLKTKVLVIPVFEDVKNAERDFVKIDNLMGRLLSKTIEADPAIGEENNFSLFFNNKRITTDKILLAGLGKRDKLDAEKIRSFGGKLVNHLKKKKVSDFSILSFGYGLKGIAIEKATQALCEGFLLGNYSHTKFKSKKDKKKKGIETAAILPQTDYDTSKIEEGMKRAEILSNSVALVRDLVNGPANVVNPAYLVKEAKDLAKQNKLKIKVFDQAQLKKEKMNTILAVGKGSDFPPYLVILEYGSAKRKQDTYCLVGKGVCFDSGGLNLKPGSYMQDMKIDMGGAATVLGVMKAVSELKLPINLIGLMPCVENMPSARSSRPGDVVTTYSGKTVEILNTDAEGRLIMADALHYSLKYKPKSIIDIATLTGACMVALGLDTVGVFGTDQELVDDILAASKETDELMWQLPLTKGFTDDIKSKIADIANLGHPKGYGGASSAAAFLKEFVGDASWAHLDIAGPAWATKDNSYKKEGGTGIPVRTLVEFFRQKS